MITGDMRKWAETTPQEIETIATTIWAKKPMKELREHQADYMRRMGELGGKEDAETLVIAAALDNLWLVATRAIDFKEFGN